MVRLYWPAELRTAFDALFAIDDALAAVVTSSTQPALGAIRLAWWRDALERLDTSPPPPEPRLEAAARELLPRGVSGTELASLEEGWAALLDDDPEPMVIERRGTRLFALGAKLLGVEFVEETFGAAGRLFARIDLARRGIVDALAGGGGFARVRIERPARPMTAFAALAARDSKRGGPPFEPEATPGRALALLRHRLFGTIS